MKKLVIVIPYFGEFPSIFPDFLNSCKYNLDINWLIFTDNLIDFEHADNIKFINMKFEEMKKLIQSNFDFKIELIRPHKLCDFKPAYGDIFKNYIEEYDFWAHGDIDLIYGRISYFIDRLISENYDKIYCLGHFTIYKNNELINKVYKNDHHGKSIYKEIFSTDKAYAFDEWHCPLGSINHLFIEAGLKIYFNNESADLNSKFNGFKLSEYVFNLDNYITDQNKFGIFEFNNGVLLRKYIYQNRLKEKEYLYIHFHKRLIKRKSQNFAKFIIKPNEIIDNVLINTETIRLLTKVSLINWQYFKVRYKNLKYKIQLFLRKKK